MSPLRYLSPEEITQHFPDAGPRVLAAVTFVMKPIPEYMRASKCEFAVLEDGKILTPTDSFELSVEELEMVLGYLKIHVREAKPVMNDFEILAAAETILRLNGVDQLHIYYNERGASDICTLERQGAKLRPDQRRIGCGTLVEAYRELGAGEKAK